MYVREQMRNFQKVEKFLKLGNFILKYGHFGNMARYIYFTYEAYGPIGGKQTKWWKKFFSRELPRTSRYLSRIMVVLSFLVIDPVFSPKKWVKIVKNRYFCQFRPKNGTFGYIPISQRVFICSWNVEYMLEVIVKSIQKMKNFWSWATSLPYSPLPKIAKMPYFWLFWHYCQKSRFFENEVAQLQNFLIF